jgi:hypothetical protein
MENDQARNQHYRFCVIKWHLRPFRLDRLRKIDEIESALRVKGSHLYFGIGGHGTVLSKDLTLSSDTLGTTFNETSGTQA